jgi:endonuclease/exonuclease/phosphatase family metal-dependent hydrolase
LLRGEQPLSLRVLSYNIHHGEGTDGKNDLERIARLIDSLNPDLVALQEVDSGTKRTHRIDQPAELARLTKMPVVFGDNIPYQGGRYGNAVLTRLPVLRFENHPLPSFYEGEQRGLMELELDLPGNRPPLLFFATHLDYRPKDEERMVSARLINQLTDSRENQAALIVGDFNSEPCSRVMCEFRKRWRHTQRYSALTYPSVNPVKQIDFILSRPFQRWRVVHSEVIGEEVASDHRPIFAILRLSQ